MRRLMWFTIGFGLACGACGLTHMFFAIPVVMLLPVITLAVGIFCGRKSAYPLALISAGCILGLIWFVVFSENYLKTAAASDGTEQAIQIHATNFSRSDGYSSCVDGTVELDGNSYRIRAYLDAEAEVQPGDSITGVFRLRYTAGGNIQEPTHHRGGGIWLLAYARDTTRITPGEKTWEAYPALVSREISDLLEAFFPADTAPFAKALLLGDVSGLTYRQDTDLKISGIRHVVAVSGLHVSILFALISTLAWKRPWLRVLIGLPMLLFFAAMTGFSPSVNRACLMCGLMLLSILLRRDYDGATALSFSCLVMLAVNPLVVVSAAFQLSVSCVAGIFLLRERINGWLLARLGKTDGKGMVPRLKRWFAGSVAVSFGATLFSLPLSAWYFGAVSLVGILTNLLTLWVVGFVFCGILGVCLLGMVHHSAAIFLAKAVSVPVRYVLLAAKTLGSFPLAAVYTQSIYIVLWLLFVYGLFFGFLLSRHRSVVITACCGIMGLCIALAASWLEPMTDEVRLTVLDVGHGQSILLQWSGNTFLVDCGGDSDIRAADLAAQTLLSQGIDHLDGLILTHMDHDHAGGVGHLLSRIETKCVLAPETGKENAFASDSVQPMQAVSFTEDGGVLTVYGPISGEGGNENSMCVLFESENCAILITGDRSGFGERMLLRYVDLPKVDVLVAGHHGSPESTGHELLKCVQPRYLVISGDNGNTELLQRLAQYDCQVWRTDRSGTLVYRR